MWSLLSDLPTLGIPAELPYGLLIALLAAGLQLAIGAVRGLLADEAAYATQPLLVPAAHGARERWRR